MDVCASAMEVKVTGCGVIVTTGCSSVITTVEGSMVTKAVDGSW